MLSNLIVSTQRFVLVIDELGKERGARDVLWQLLREQGQTDTIKTLPLSAALRREATFEAFLGECTANAEDKWTVLLPTLADLLCYQRPAVIFQFLQKLRKCAQVSRIFLWASPQHLMHPRSLYVLSACEYMSDLVLRIATATELSILTRKQGGSVTNKRYSYTKSNAQFLVEPLKSARGSPEQTAVALEKSEPPSGTFKIELDEDELVARNALKLPYEKTAEIAEGNIIYTPDADDDFDDEDPDEDLCI